MTTQNIINLADIDHDNIVLKSKIRDKKNRREAYSKHSKKMYKCSDVCVFLSIALAFFACSPDIKPLDFLKNTDLSFVVQTHDKIMRRQILGGSSFALLIVAGLYRYSGKEHNERSKIADKDFNELQKELIARQNNHVNQ